jgi:oligoribonuclease NrnB/cAMP/cGMP phosphodiesterase (DHH superfamily)
MANNTKYRLLTRSDLDGLICAVLLKHLGMVDEIKLIDNPGVMQERSMKISAFDITTNLPFVPGVHLAIDHHVSESIRNQENPRHVIDPDAPSAARVVYNYFGGRKRFPDFFEDMMTAVDKADSGQFTHDEILHPTGWALLNFLVDKRTNLEPWGTYRIPEAQFKLNVIDLCQAMTIDKILAEIDVRQRADIYFQYEDAYKNLLRSAAVIHHNVAVLDFRGRKKIYPGNRFIIYALFPHCNVSILIRSDEEKEKTVFSIGKSILNKTSTVNIGELMLSLGGGGHRSAGACHVDNHMADQVFESLLEKLSVERK